MSASVTAEYVDTKAAAEFLGLKPSTLARWRCTRSDGPPHHSPGGRRIVYAVSELRDWMGGWRRRSTSDSARAASIAR